MPKEKEESGTESQKQRRRKIEDQSNPIGPNRRKLSIEDVPEAIRVIDGRTLSELPGWLYNSIVSAIQQLNETSHANGHTVDNVQILLEVIDECKLKLAKVANGGEGKLQLCTDERERERARAGARSGTISVSKYEEEYTTKSLSEYRIYGHIFIRMLRRSWEIVAKCVVRIWGSVRMVEGCSATHGARNN